ncbi:MAG TPA: fibronectin type III domain-containing protein [Thermoanaerobaculia bacterium]|nr:fibronectin type III domain-containing protein [Thermoanaerobaculia bacterium]
MRTLLLLLFSLTTLSAGAAGRELAPREVASTPYAKAEAHTAFAGGRFLTVWQEDMGYLGRQVMGAFSDANGRRVSPRSFPLALPEMRDYWSMQLVAMGDSFALFRGNAELGAVMIEIDLAGKVTAVRTVELPHPVPAKFAWNGEYFLALQSPSYSYAEAALLDRDGKIVRAGIPLPQAANQFDVVVMGREFAVVTNGPPGLFLQLISENGAGRRRTIADWYGTSEGPYRPQDAVVTLTPSGRLLIVWSAGTYVRQHLRAVTFTNDAEGTLSPVRLLAENAGSIVPLGVLSTGGEAMVAFSALEGYRNELRTVRFATPEEAAAPSSGTSQVLLFPSITTERHVVSVAIGVDGQRRAPELLSLGFSRQSQPILGAGGGNVLATWTESADTVRSALVTPDGEPLPAAPVAHGTIAARELAWSGAYQLGVQRDGRKLTAMRITADGRAVDKEPIVLAEMVPPALYPASVVWTGEQWVVVWTAGSRLRVARVSAAGIPSAARSLPLPLAPPDSTRREVQPPLVAFDGEHVLVLWTEISMAPCELAAPPCPFTDPRRFALLLTPDGSPTDDVPFELPIGFGTSIASSGSEFLILDGTRATVLVKGRNRLRIAAMRELFNYPATSDVTWDGRDYVVALRYTGANWYLALKRLDRNLQDVGETRGTRTLAPDQFEQPSVAAPFAGEALIGLQEGTPADGVRAVVYREADLAPLPPRPDAPRNVRLRQLGTDRYEVTWEPSAGAEQYRIEALGSDGEWHWIAGTDAGTHHATVRWPNLRVSAFNAGGASEPGYPDAR